MKKNLLVLSAVCLLSGGVLASCGDSVDKDAIVIWTSVEDHKFMTQAADMYNTKFPEEKIKISLVAKPEGDSYAAFNLDPAAAGDIIHFAGNQYGNYMKLAGLEPISTSLIEANKLNVDILPETMALGQTSNTQYALPYSMNSYGMFYNKKIFTENDVTSLDSMLAVVAPEGYKCDYNFGYDMGNGFYNDALLISLGVQLFGPNADDYTAPGINTAEGLKATKEIVKLYKNKKFYTVQEAGGNFDAAASMTVKDGKCKIGAFVSGPWDTEKLTAAIGKDDIGFAPLPKLTVDGALVDFKCVADNKFIGVNKNKSADKKAKSAKFASFLASTEVQAIRTTCVPTSKIAINGSNVNPLAKAIFAAPKFKNPPVLDQTGWWDNSTKFYDELRKLALGDKFDEYEKVVTDDELTAACKKLNDVLISTGTPK